MTIHMSNEDFVAFPNQFCLCSFKVRPCDGLTIYGTTGGGGTHLNRVQVQYSTVQYSSKDRLAITRRSLKDRCVTAVSLTQVLV